ncbi:peptidase S8/S53 domain-containing protein [Mycena latifolia]|nr:peptidase S8/S53 domain-containing protein [Mycena latifolia]
MFSRRTHSSWMILLVYLALCSTIMAAVVEGPTVEARAAKAKVKAVAKPKAPPVKAPVAKPPAVKPPPPTKKPVAKPPPAAKPPVKAPVKPAAPKKAPVKPVAPKKAPIKPTAPKKAPINPAVPKKAPVKPAAPKKAPTKPVAKPPTAKPPVKKPPTTKPPVTKPPVKKPPTGSKPPAKPPVKASASKKVPTKSAVPSAAPSASGLVCVKPTRQKRATKAGDTVPNQFIVHLKPGVNYAKHIATVKSLITQGAKCDSTKSAITLDSPVVAKLSMYGGIFGPSVVAALKKSPDVKSVVGNTLLEVDSPIPIAPAANVTTRGLTTKFATTQTNSWSLARLNTGKKTVTDAISEEDFTPNAPASARNRNTRNWPFTNVQNAGQGINVYIIDTGVSDHDDLAGRIVRKNGANVATGAANIDDTTDTNGHGTRMAGIIAGQTVGVAKSATIIPVKAGATGAISQLDIMAGLAFAVTDAKGKPGVINISVTMLKDQNDGLPAMITSVIGQGMHIVNSAGNRNGDQCATRIGTGDGPITVGNVGIDDQKAFSSNFGACLTVFAPGNDIQTTAFNNPANFISGSGTSEATAHTSGLVATLLSQSKLSPAAMKKKVVSLAVKVPTIVAASTTNLLIQVPKPLLK